MKIFGKHNVQRGKKARDGKMTALWAAIMMIAVAMTSASPAAAQDDDDDPILDEEVVLPGLNVTVQAFLGGLDTATRTPVDPLFVHQPLPNQNYTIPGAEKRRVCLADENATGVDAVECRYVIQERLTATCATIFNATRTIPVIGPGVADQLEQVARAMDEHVTQALRSFADDPDMPPELRDRVGRVAWNDTAYDLLVDCKGSIQSVKSLLGVDSSELTIELGAEIPICPWRQMIPYCDRDFNSTQGASEGYDEIENTTASSSCSFDDLQIHCTRLGDENPFKDWNALVENLSSVLRIELDIHDHDIQTLRTNEGTARSQGGAVRCGHGGVPDNDGELAGSWSLDVSAEMSKGSLPPQAYNTLSPVVLGVFEAANSVLDDASTTWAGKMRGLVDGVNENWTAEQWNFTGDEAHQTPNPLHPHTDGGGGRLDDSECTHQDPETDVRVPQVENPNKTPEPPH